MAVFRVPYPRDPERRRALFEEALARLGPFGTCRGTPDAGTFEGRTPLGDFAGSYQSLEETDEIEFAITKKPFFIATGMIESKVRGYFDKA